MLIDAASCVGGVPLDVAPVLSVKLSVGPVLVTIPVTNAGGVRSEAMASTLMVSAYRAARTSAVSPVMTT